MSLEHVEFIREKTRKPKKNAASFSFNKSNSFSSPYSANDRRNTNISPIYTKYGNVPPGAKDPNRTGFFYTIVSVIKSIFQFLYLLVTDFSMKRVTDMFSAIIDFIFLKPIRAIKHNKIFIVVIASMALVMCMGFVMDFTKA